MADLTILYRGPLSSCNYDCSYCPFAKRHESAAELTRDRRALERFVDWVAEHDERAFRLFFTPWGEALTRTWYQQAFVRLSGLEHVDRVVAQTNLSYRLEWLQECVAENVALWCTYHPSQTSRSEFLAQCRQLRACGIRHSVGMVGLPDCLEEIEAMRRELPSDTYLWINAWDTGDGPKYAYTATQLHRLQAVDPLFSINATDHASLGRSCRTGRSVVSVDGDGTIRRCHFVKKPIGNLYGGDLEHCLCDRPCPNTSCGCYIGYVHLDHLRLGTVYGDSLLERIPQ